jgi:hypothetical protein
MLIAVFVLGAALAQAVPIRSRNLQELCKNAELIVIGQVGALDDLGQSDMQFGNRSMRINHLRAHMVVEQILKGQVDSPQLSIDFIQTQEFVGYHGLPPQSYQVVFLKRGTSGWELADPFYPSFRAVPGTELKDVRRITPKDAARGNVALPEEDTKNDVVMSVTKVLAAALDSNLVSDNERYGLIGVLGQIFNTTSSAALVRAARSPNLSVRVCALGELLRRNEVTVLPEAVSLISAPDTPREFNPGCPLRNITSGIAIGVRRYWAVPYLGELLKLDDVHARRAAATALRRIGAEELMTKPEIAMEKVAPLLVQALEDSDQEVRYEAVLGLARMTKSKGWAPLEEEFRQDDEKYLAHWKEWAEVNVH